MSKKAGISHGYSQSGVKFNSNLEQIQKNGR
eukprot:Gb_23574 [translate_table: standard]